MALSHGNPLKSDTTGLKYIILQVFELVEVDTWSYIHATNSPPSWRTIFLYPSGEWLYKNFGSQAIFLWFYTNITKILIIEIHVVTNNLVFIF